MRLIGIKYCGGCNPFIDRAKLVSEIGKVLSPKYSLTTEPPSNPWDIGIMVCGCSSACVDKPEIRKLARQWIFVAGKSIDLENAPEEKLADIAAEKIKKLK
jgi:3-hydroxyacyl-[acyl-carrier-protein] dehydratase